MAASAPKMSKSAEVREWLQMKLRDNAEGVTDVELRQALDTALRADEPGYLGIDVVELSESRVIYAVAPEDALVLYRRGYTFKDGEATLAGKKEAVEPVVRYEPVAASAQPSQPCGCAIQKGATMKTKAERIAALIADAANGWTEETRPFLETCTDDQLTTLETKVIVAAQNPAPKPPASPSPTPSSPSPSPSPAPSPQPPSHVVDPEPVTLASLIAAAPPDVRNAFASLTAAAATKKAASIATLKGTGRCKFSDEQLNAMDQTALDSMVELVGAAAPVNYAGLGMPRAAGANGNDNTPPPAPPLTALLGNKGNQGQQAS